MKSILWPFGRRNSNIILVLPFIINLANNQFDHQSLNCKKIEINFNFNEVLIFTEMFDLDEHVGKIFS